LNILGISAFYHDSGASLIINGEVVSAIQEERITRIKHDSSFPSNAIKKIIKDNAISLCEVDYIVFYEKPFLKFERIIETYLINIPRGFSSFLISMPLWVKEKIFQKNIILQGLKKIDNNCSFINKLKFCEHHLSHAASAYYPSPFNEAVVLTLDGVGEWATTTVSLCSNNKINIIKEIKFPHSLGLLYSAFTYYAGFKVNSGEYKLMGLAPYGKPIYRDIIFDQLVSVKNDGSFNLNQKYFNYSTGLTMINKKFCSLFGRPSRNQNEKLEQFHMDIAASIQSVTESILVKIVKNLAHEYSIDNLCLAGGVALNCVANGRIANTSLFKDIWIQPAAGDAGGSLGAALAYYYNELGHKRHATDKDLMQKSLLGASFSDTEISSALEDLNANFTVHKKSDIVKHTAEYLSQGKIVGWFQGRMEFGPRALGARSILADPRSEAMQNDLNLKIKYREGFRPFAASILSKFVNKYYDLDKSANLSLPYMLIVAKLKQKYCLSFDYENTDMSIYDLAKLINSIFPAVTHIDYTSRLQSVDEDNGIFYDLLDSFNEKTGCPVLVNTSFNIRGEPVVYAPEEAFRCFMGTGIDVLVINNCIMLKEDQNVKINKHTYKNSFTLD
jgi:carbamoyltransferase